MNLGFADDTVRWGTRIRNNKQENGTTAIFCKREIPYFLKIGLHVKFYM